MTHRSAAGLVVNYRRPDGQPDSLKLVGPLGQGGTATVFDAMGEVRSVVKLPRKELFWGKNERVSAIKEERAREVQMLLQAARVEHEDAFHLAELLGVGLLDDGVPFIVMRYVDGRNLGDVIDEAFLTLHQRPSASTVVGALLGAARGLRLLHDRGILHRDVKSNNIVVPLGRPDFSVLVDLGTAKPVSGEADLRTSGEMGPEMNVLYSAPEYVNNWDATIRTDLYSLGITAYEALVGEYPHQSALTGPDGKSPPRAEQLGQPGMQMKLLSMRTRFAPKVPDDVRGAYPQALVELVESLIAPEPRNRPASAAFVVRELDRIWQHLDGSAMRYRPTAAPAPAPESAVSAPAITPPSIPADSQVNIEPSPAGAPARPRRYWLVPATAALAALVIGGVWFASNSGSHESSMQRGEDNGSVAPSEPPPTVAIAAVQPDSLRRRATEALRSARRSVESAVELVRITVVADPMDARIQTNRIAGISPLVLADLRPGEELEVELVWPDGRTLSHQLRVSDSDEVRTFRAPASEKPAAASAGPGARGKRGSVRAGGPGKGNQSPPSASGEPAAADLRKRTKY